MSMSMVENSGKVMKKNQKKIKPELINERKPYYFSEFLKRDVPAKKKWVYYCIDTALELNEIDDAVAGWEALGYSKDMITSFRYEKISKKTWQEDGTVAFVPKWHTEIRIRVEPGFDVALFASKCFEKSHIEPLSFN